MIVLVLMLSTIPPLKTEHERKSRTMDPYFIPAQESVEKASRKVREVREGFSGAVFLRDLRGLCGLCVGNNGFSNRLPGQSPGKPT